MRRSRRAPSSRGPQASIVATTGTTFILIVAAIYFLIPGWWLFVSATVFLFSFVATWNNFFLPLVMLKDASMSPVTLGIFNWFNNNQTPTPTSSPARSCPSCR